MAGLLSNLAKSQKIVTVDPSVSVQEAARIMTQNKIGSVVILEGGRLAGIFTERDLLNRVVAQGVDSDKTPVSRVMTKDVVTIDLEDSVEASFKKMEQTRCRRLPITDDGKVVGMVTMRNILEWLMRNIEEENIYLKKYIQS